MNITKFHTEFKRKRKKDKEINKTEEIQSKITTLCAQKNKQTNQNGNFPARFVRLLLLKTKKGLL
jgi:hypothetical protein